MCDKQPQTLFCYTLAQKYFLIYYLFITSKTLIKQSFLEVSVNKKNLLQTQLCNIGPPTPIAGLPEHAEQLIQASSQMGNLDLPQVLAHAQAILKNFTGSVEQVAEAAQPPHCMPRGIDTQTRCYSCDGPNH